MVHLFSIEKTLSCDNCVFTYKTQRIWEKSYNEFNVTAKALRDSFLQGKCLVKFSRTQGYYVES